MRLRHLHPCPQCGRLIGIGTVAYHTGKWAEYTAVTCNLLSHMGLHPTAGSFKDI